jgi:prepilin-type N-terminal cleavage/methylation domain-containing protein/prepilin-type processing-associated H-X9-DG protein
MNGTRKRPAFTIVEVMVVVVIISLLVAVLLPALVAARRRARIAQDQNNLRQLGMGLLTFADRDPLGRFCTGAYDFRRDGCPDTWGWVADLVPLGVVPGELLNPASVHPGIEEFQTMLSAPARETGLGGCPNQRLADGACGKDVEWDGSSYTGDLFSGTGAGLQERADYLGQHLLDRGYNTNYVASWYLVRGSIRLTQTDNGGVTSWSFKGDTREQEATMGPLTTRTVDNALVPSGNIPLLGDGAAGDPGDSSLALDIPGQKREALTGGSRLSETFNPGPAAYDGTGASPRIVLLPTTTDTYMTRQVVCEREGIPCNPADVSQTDHGWLQDTRGWYAVNGGSCNILMADGSVKEFEDLDNDGFLNPGFPIPPGDGGGAVGYQSDRIELPPGEIYSGVFLEPVRPRL